MAVVDTLAKGRERARLRAGPLLVGLLAIAAAVPLSLAIHVVNERVSGGAEAVTTVVGAMFIVVLAAPPGAYLLAKRRVANPITLGLIVISCVGVVATSAYFYWVSAYLFFPGDFLIWTESDFVNDILKFRIGYPIYTAEVNNESFNYVPGPALLTYALAWILDNPLSVPLYRIIQVFYSLLAAIVAFLCCRMLIALRHPELEQQAVFPWGVLWLPLLFLLATNSLTNPFVHNLNNDSLAQLFWVVGYFILLKYMISRDRRLLVLMVLLPAAGFLVKQNLLAWIGLFALHLAVFDRPRSLVRLAWVIAASVASVLAVLGMCYLIWGWHFFYWTVEVLAAHGVSPVRSFQHLLRVWPYFAIGLLGGAVMLRGRGLYVLFGPWLIWLAIILLQTYTSGIAYMINHIGPGSLIAGIWFVAALTVLWSSSIPRMFSHSNLHRWMGSAIAAGLVLLLLSGLDVIRIPVQPLSDDAARYVNEIEARFEGIPTEEVLLDMGTWVYLEDEVIMKDRAPAIGERGYSQTGDFSGVLGRIEDQYYSRILVRNLHEPNFWYDHANWAESSNIRRAMLTNYREVGVIEGVEGSDKYGFSDISILVPR